MTPRGTAAGTPAPGLARAVAAPAGKTTTIVAGSAPYPWPYHGQLDPARLALLIAGMDPPWTQLAGAEGVLERLGRLVPVLRARGAQVVVVHHRVPARPGWRASSNGSSNGSNVISAELRHLETYADIVCEGGLDGFYASPLDDELRRLGCDLLAVGGFGLEGPVHSTMRAANDRGYECLLLSDATSAVDPDLRNAALSTITMSGGVFGAVGTAIALCDALETTIDSKEKP